MAFAKFLGVLAPSMGPGDENELRSIKLGIDLVKLQWKSNMSDERLPEKKEKIREMVERTGKAKVIMCHVDSEDALRFGHSIGIAMYQGRFIDALVAPRNAANRPR